ncbi:hypothetical protein HU200_031885 [Digitaria exilis]|uniref:Uncharacterized protein n=1 Tax=Digitaria exilis TaxID=1010633 RepID=A0A835BUS6_9POAL|nr:hypothetical protein HU200_031885 [Digitaria exilis]
MSLPECAKGDIALQHPGAATIFKGIGAEKERLLPGHLDEAQLPLADPHATVPANRPQPFHSLSGQDWAKRHPMLQRPAITVVIKSIRAEHGRFILRHLGVAQPPLTDPHAPEHTLCGDFVRARHWGHAAPRQLDKAETHHSRPAKATTSWSISIRRVSGSGDGKATSFSHSPKPPHDEPLLPPVVVLVLVEYSDSVPARRPVRAFGLGEDADVVAVHGLLRAVDVREANNLAAERVQDEARGVGVPVNADQCACPIGAVPGDDGSRAAEIRELEEEEAIGAGGADEATEGQAHGVAVGVGEGRRVDKVGGDEDVGGARGCGELEGRARRRRIDQHGEGPDHSPWRAQRGSGESAAEATGGGGGEAKEAPERHLDSRRSRRGAALGCGGGCVATTRKKGNFARAMQEPVHRPGACTGKYCILTGLASAAHRGGVGLFH